MEDDRDEQRFDRKRSRISQKVVKSKKFKCANTEKSAPEVTTANTPDTTLCNYRRFSSRSRRKTEFFSPVEGNKDPGNGGKEVERAVLLNDSYRRALHFSDKKLVQSLQNAWPQMATTPEQASLKIAEEENKFAAPYLKDGATAATKASGRCIHREPMQEVSWWDQV